VKLAVFGGTGASGQLLIRSALAQGHTVTAYARNPAKLPPADDLTVIQGQLDDTDGVQRTINGVDAVISLLGPGRDKASIPPLMPGTQTIVDAMTDTGVRRLVATSTPSVPDPADRHDLRLTLMIAAVRYGMPAAYRAIVGMADVIRSSPLEWTLVRLPLLHDRTRTGAARPRRVGEPGGLRLSRSALAAFLLQEAQTPRWIHQAPLLADS
jgi:hypothetical protein